MAAVPLFGDTNVAVVTSQCFWWIFKKVSYCTTLSFTYTIQKDCLHHSLGADSTGLVLFSIIHFFVLAMATNWYRKGVIGLAIKNLCVSMITIYNACIIIHSANCDVVIPEEEQLSSMPCREFVIFRGSAVNNHSLFKLWLSKIGRASCRERV